MNTHRVGRLCRVCGIAAMIIAAVPFLAFSFKVATTKVNDVPQERFAYDDTYSSALLWWAVVGFALGCALLVCGWRCRSKRREVLPES